MHLPLAQLALPGMQTTFLLTLSTPPLFVHMLLTQALLAKGSILPVMRATEQHNKPFLTQV
jgi:hypothetical protein